MTRLKVRGRAVENKVEIKLALKTGLSAGVSEYLWKMRGKPWASVFQCAGFRGTYLVPMLWSVHYGVPTTVIRFVSFLSLLRLLSTLFPHGYHSHHEQLPTCWVSGLLPYKDLGRVVLAIDVVTRLWVLSLCTSWHVTDCKLAINCCFCCPIWTSFCLSGMVCL